MPTSIRLPTDLEKRLNALAERTGRTRAFYLRQIIAAGLEEAEDLYLAQEVMGRVREGKEKVFTLDQVEQSLGLAD